MVQPINPPAPAAHVEGINRENRALLERLHRDLPGAFDVEHASAALGLEADRTRKLLAYLARRGWLSRVRRGLYVAVPLDTRRPGEWVEDAWVVADRIFDPCYIGGWSACEHWSLTDQVFRTVVVVTAKKVRSREPVSRALPIASRSARTTSCSARPRCGVIRLACRSLIPRAPSWTCSTTLHSAAACATW